ncbi:MAG: glutamate synthase [Sedimentibacter sp.]
MVIKTDKINHKNLNINIKNSTDNNILLKDCSGQRYIASGLSDKNIVIEGIPGNALGSYLNGCNITVRGNVQDAVGDTMNAGNIYVHGSSGDATGYAMRGGKIFVEKDAGYRTGIHMKAYKEKLPVIVVGGSTGSFLGEYQAGGIIIVLGLNSEIEPPVGYFCATGMYGGKIYLRSNKLPVDLPVQIEGSKATEKDMEEIEIYIDEFCNEFSYNKEEILSYNFYVLTPNKNIHYKQIYINN